MEERRMPRRAYPGPAEEKPLPRMRTAANIVREIKAMDPGSDVTEYWVRRLAKSGRVPVATAGRKILLNLDDVLEIMRAGVSLEPEPKTQKAPKVVPLAIPQDARPPVRGIRRIEV